MEEEILSSARGVRFAPSPTGRFHIGNLRTAWIAAQWARHLGEPWVVRFEDIDAPRSAPGALESQLADLARLGLRPDETLIQSRLYARHWETFRRAALAGSVYPCFCSRKEVRDALEGSGSAPHGPASAPPGDPPIYSGHCRGLKAWPEGHGLPTLAWRFAVEEDPSGAHDFIVARTGGRAGTELTPEGLPADAASYAPAYHWACAVDDFDGRYRLLVRAADLAPVLPQQRAIMRWLGASEGLSAAQVARRLPAVFHTALVTQDDGHRLEKRTLGVSLDELEARGWSARRCVEAFERSWDRGCLAGLRGGADFGEAHTTLTLTELGIQG